MRDQLEIKTNILDLKRNKSSIKIDSRVRDLTSIPNISLNLLIYLFTYSLFYLLSFQYTSFNSQYFVSLGIYLASILAGITITGKYKLRKSDSSEKTLRTIYLSSLLAIFSLFIIFLFFDIKYQTRTLLLIALFSGLLIEITNHIFSKNFQSTALYGQQFKRSVKYIILDSIILTSFCYFEIVRNIDSIYPKEEFLLLAIIYLSWVVSAAATHKFIPAAVSTSRLNAFELQIKFYFRIIALVVLSIIFLQLEFSTAEYYIKALFGYSFVSSLLFMFLFAKKIKNKSDEATVVFLKAYEIKDNEAASHSISKKRNGKYSFINSSVVESSRVDKNEMQFENLQKHSEVFTVLDTILDLRSFDTQRSLIINSDEPNEISLSQPESYQLVANLHVLNDQKHVNKHILDIKDAMVPGGVFVGALLPHHYRYKRFLKENSFWIANFKYSIDFIWKRVLPKLPITREIYEAFSSEKDRAISLAEGLGRLVYCGFKILDLVAVDDVVYFAAVKNGSFKPVKKFFYSPIFKMKRIGKNGKLIYVYKLRTMYPYSEFIQDFVYNHNKLESGGKFKDDFRVPIWGSLFRKFWIDELPMLINLVKGDLKFFGVRPISEQYLSLYSPEHQERRKKFKPGMVPPFYADLPNSIEEIELSEKRYLDNFEKNPVKTDIRYFIKAVNNILFKKKRSA